MYYVLQLQVLEGVHELGHVDARQFLADAPACQGFCSLVIRGFARVIHDFQEVDQVLEVSVLAEFEDEVERVRLLLNCSEN